MSKALCKIKLSNKPLKWSIQITRQLENILLNNWIEFFSWHLCSAPCTGLYQNEEPLPNLAVCFFLNSQPDRINFFLRSCKYWKITIVVFYWVETLSESQNAVSTNKVLLRCDCPFTFVCSMSIFTSQLQGWVTETVIFDSKSQRCFYFGPPWKRFARLWTRFTRNQ